MTLPTSLTAYDNCIEALDKALDAKRGIRMTFEDHGAANFFRMRCHQARKLTRERNAKIFADPQHPMHGRSLYDALVLRIQQIGDETYLYIERNNILPGKIEDLDDVDEAAE